MNQSYISSEFVDYTCAANLITKNALNSLGANDRHVSHNDGIYISAKIEGNSSHETTTITIQNNYAPNNVFSQIESKPSYTDSFTYSSQGNHYNQGVNSGVNSFDDKSAHNTTGLGQYDSKISYGSSSKNESNSY